MMNLDFPQPAVAMNRYKPFVQNFHSSDKGTIFALSKTSLFLLSTSFNMTSTSLSWSPPSHCIFYLELKMLSSGNDLFNGRPNAKGVPQSDQWDDDIKMPRIPKKWREAVYHKTQVMVGDNGPGVYRQIQDEIFMSKQCLRDLNGNSRYPNPLDGRMELDKFCFHFPATWYYSHAVNKAIGLRRISVQARWYSFKLSFKITLPTGALVTLNVALTVPPDMNLAVAMGVINRKMAQELTRLAVPADMLLQYAQYFPASNLVRLNFIAGAGHLASDFAIEFLDTGELDDFFDMMNVPTDKRASYIGTHANLRWEFTDVWDRVVQHLYFHASFVNHTQFNYLGQQGDFYPKPSKIYSADNLPSECYFWVSLDCMTPIALKFEHFIIELAFIIDSTDYQSP
jgi:hypothetical protein